MEVIDAQMVMLTEKLNEYLHICYQSGGATPDDVVANMNDFSERGTRQIITSAIAECNAVHKKMLEKEVEYYKQVVRCARNFDGDNVAVGLLDMCVDLFDEYLLAVKRCWRATFPVNHAVNNETRLSYENELIEEWMVLLDMRHSYAVAKGRNKWIKSKVTEFTSRITNRRTLFCLFGRVTNGVSYILTPSDVLLIASYI
jgi:hypothetical protein